MVQNGQLIGPPDFPEYDKCYIRPEPDLVVTHIKSFSTNVWRNFEYKDWQIISITLLPADAAKVIEIQNKEAVDLSLDISPLCKLDNKPTCGFWIGKPTGWLFFHKGQDIHDVVQGLQKLVHPK